MRVLVISSGHSLDDDRITRKQAVSLAVLGHEVTVCARARLDYQEPRIRMIDADTLQVIERREVATNYRPVSRFDRMYRLLRLYRVTKKEKPDLIVAHEFETGLLAWWIKKRLDIPYVFDAHECFEETTPQIGRAHV